MAEDERDPAARTIVVGVDGSDSSVRASRWACRLAELDGSAVDLVTAWQWPVSWGPAMPLPEDYDPGADVQAMLDEIAGELAREFPEVRLRALTIKGHPAVVLIEASRHADLLVVSSRGHGEVTGVLIGSVSLHCVTHAASPVLVHR
jgi:nucleotide-binding universal stress UspA family protein